MSKNSQLVQCPNCGANYLKEEKVCPYCGAENIGLAVKEFNEQVIDKTNQIVNELTRPQRFVAAVRKYLNYIIIAIIAVVIIVTAIIVVTKEKVPAVYEVSEEHIDELQAAVDAKDYDKMCKILDTYSLYGGKYRAYTRLADVYYEYESVIENENKARENASPDQFYFEESTRLMSVGIDASYCIEYGLRTIRQADDYLGEGTKYGTEDNIKELKDAVYEKLHDWGIDNSAIDALYQDYEENGSTIADDNSEIRRYGNEAAKIIIDEETK